MAYITLVSVPEDAIKRYFGILDKFAIRHLRWTFVGSTDPFPKDKLSDCGLALGNHDVNIHTVQLHFSIWKELHLMIKMKKRPIPRCLQIVPTSIAYWNKSKVYIDVVSRLLSHIKIPFGKADPILQIIVRFIMIMVVNGHLTTQYALLDNKMFTDPIYSYTDIRKSMAKHTNLHEYIASVAEDFKIPSNRPIQQNASTCVDVCDEMLCGDINQGVLLKNLPMKCKLSKNELSTYTGMMKKL